MCECGNVIRVISTDAYRRRVVRCYRDCILLIYANFICNMKILQTILKYRPHRSVLKPVFLYCPASVQCVNLI